MSNGQCDIDRYVDALYDNEKEKERFMGFDLNISIPAITVFLQGILSFFSPCIFPLIPLYMGYLSGGVRKDKNGDFHYQRGKVLFHTVFFVVGISFTFFLLGLGVSAAGTFFTKNQAVFARVGGIIVILLGLYQMGLFGPSRLLGNEHRISLKIDKMTMSPITALLMGFTFSFAWTPCVGPALSGVLLMTASAATRTKGFLMIGIYTLGFVLPFLAVGIFTTALLKIFRNHGNIVKYTVRIGAVLMICMGLMMLTGKMNGVTGYLSTGSKTSESVKDDGNKGNAAKNKKEPGAASDDESKEGEKASTAIDFTLTDQYGEEHSLSDYRGKVVLLNFWATWCSVCKQEMPDLQNLYEDYGPEGNAVILGIAFPGIAGEGNREDITAFLEENGYTYPVLMDESGELMDRFGIMAYPTTYMIDKDGKIYGYVNGMVGKGGLESMISQTLEGK